MKIFGILCIQAITAQETEVDECMKEENKDLSSNYCRTRGKTLDNDKLYNDAVDRYREQEAEFNFLGQCYNQLKAWGQEQGDREWDFRDAEIKYGKDCPSGDRLSRDCFMESDWNTLFAALNNVNIFSQETLSNADKLYNEMLNYKNCIGDHCGIEIKRIF